MQNCLTSDHTLIFYSGHEMTRFESVGDLVRNVPFQHRDWTGLWPGADPAGHPYIIAVEEKVRQELDARHIAYTAQPRPDAPANMQDFADWGKAVAQHVTDWNAAHGANVVVYYELWNEANGSFFLGTYAQLAQ